MNIKGIHHISSIVWQGQENLDFYHGVLGLRLVKQTVNYDDPFYYHLYYGNKNGDLGTLLTFFPWPIEKIEGQVGKGQVGVISLMVPKGSLDFWVNRLDKFKVGYGLLERFGNQVLRFQDRHNLSLELIESELGQLHEYEVNGITKEVAIKGIFGATLYSNDLEGTKKLFIELGLKYVGQDKGYLRFEANNDLGKYIELYTNDLKDGVYGGGTHHHIAFTIPSDEIEYYQTTLRKLGYQVSPVRERTYFQSLYFKEPGGILIELATDGPGFTVDEPLVTLGQTFVIPEEFSHLKEGYEGLLYPLFIRQIDKLEDYPYETKAQYDSYITHKNRLNRINELARLSKERELTPLETLERARLRKEYVKAIRSTVSMSMESISVETETGESVKLTKQGE